MGPVLAALAAAAFKGIFDWTSQGIANRYNSPMMQRRRLRKAGLPLAYMYQGRVNQQSDVPKLSIDPFLGTVAQKQLGLGQQKVDISQEQLKIALEQLGINWEKLKVDQGKLDVSKGQLGVSKELLELREKLTDEQILKLAQEIRQLSAQAGIKEGEAKWLSKIGETGVTKQEENLQIAQDTAKADLFIKQNEGALRDLSRQLEQTMFEEGITQEQRRQELQKTLQQINNMKWQGNVMSQLIDIRALDAQINETIGRLLDETEGTEGDVLTAVYMLLLKLLEKL